MTRKTEPPRGGRGNRKGSKVSINLPKTHHTNSAKTTQFPKLEPLAIVALHRYHSALLAMDFSPEASHLVEAVDIILDAHEGGHRD